MLHAARITAVLIALATGAVQAAALTLESASPEALRQQLKSGDDVTITTNGGRTLELRITRVEGESLSGTEISGKRYRVQYSAIRRIEVETVARKSGVVELPDTEPGSSSAWFGLSAGLMAGGVDLPCGPNHDPGDDCSEGGMFTTSAISFTVTGDLAVRLRGVRANEETERRPYETAVLVGKRMTPGSYLLVGFGSIHNADDEYTGGNTSGLAWEFLIADPVLKGLGFEASIHGNHFGDAEYAGLSLGLRFGGGR